jgi:hypothetical protein
VLLDTLCNQGPSAADVASDLLRGELKLLYPDLAIDPDRTAIGTPRWKVVDDELFSIGVNYESLTHALVRQSMRGTFANYLEGEHFLTHQTESDNPLHLEVSIEQIARLLNECAQVFFGAFQEQQLAFWNEQGRRLPHWQAFSEGLRQALNVGQVNGWNADQCALARTVSAFPDKSERLARHPESAQIQVCLIDIDAPDTTHLKHVMLAGAAVLQGSYKGQDILMMYTVEFGYETFDSMAALGASMQKRLENGTVSYPLSLRLVEPQGNFFDHMAWALICTELRAIGARKGSDTPPVETDDELAADETSAPQQVRPEALEYAVPDWLLGASVHDLSAYSRHLLELSTLRNEAPKDLFNIPPIKAFAQDKMKAAILADQPTAQTAALALDSLQIHITYSFTAGDLQLPNLLDRQTQTLGEYALTNSPPYLASIDFTDGHAVPEWLDDKYLTKIAQQVDIGQVYPQLIKTQLIDDPVEAPRQKQFYKTQLRTLLPLLALECKVRQKGDVDEVGHRYITELLKPAPDIRRPIVIRPLALRPAGRISHASDTVLNMFIIGPRNPEDGPCLLYRPLLETPLRQFQSVQNMLYAMYQPGELRDSILAWLPDQALSFNYSQYMFPVGLPSPWLVFQPLSEPLNLREWSGPVTLSTTELSGDIFGLLFDANASAMVELADRQSQSNAQRRWALLEDSGWAVFNVATNFLNGYAGAAVWVWQAVNDLQQALDAHTQGKGLVEWTHLGDVLMALAIVLVHRANVKRQRGTKNVQVSRRKQPLPEVGVAPHVTIGPTVSANRLLRHGQNELVALEGSVPRRTPGQLEAYLDTLMVAPPDPSTLEPQPETPGTPPLPQTKDKTYAQVGPRWFEVVDDDDVLVLNPNDPTSTGPRLLPEPPGKWRIDTSLRLLGSGRDTKRKLLDLRKDNTQRRQELEQKKGDLNAKFRPLKAEYLKEIDALGDLSGTAPLDMPRLQRCLDTAESLIAEYQQALAEFEEWRNKGGGSGYVEELLTLNSQYQAQITDWIRLKQAHYTRVTTTVLASLAADSGVMRQAVLDNIALAIRLGNDMRPKLELRNASQQALSALGAPGLLKAALLEKNAPAFTQWNIKANELAISYELCIREQAALDMDAARLAVRDAVRQAAQVSKALAHMVNPPHAATALEPNIDNLTRFVDQYSSLHQRIDELPQDYPELVEPAHLARVQALIGEFQQLARTLLGPLLTRPAAPPLAPPRPAKAGHSRQAPKVSKTRPRDPPKQGEPKPKVQPLVDAPLPDVDRALTSPQDIGEIVNRGMDLTTDFNDFIKRTKKDALRPNRVPADMQDLFDQQATRSDQAAHAIDTMNAEAAKAGEPAQVAGLPAELRGEGVALRREGITLRANMLKKRKPRQAYFQWLYNNAQVRLVRNEAGRIVTQQYQDCFQEYLILDTANHDKPLWVAHFHYPTLKTALSDFSAAHLKIAPEHLEQFAPEVREALTTRTPLDNELRKLRDPSLQALFLELERPPA